MDTQSQQSVERCCIAIIAKSKLIPEASVTREQTFDELQIDSLDKINISFEIEDRFNIQIPDNSIGGLKTVGDIIDGVVRLQGQASEVARDEAAFPSAADDPQSHSQEQISR